MPNHLSQRIASLRKLVTEGLHEANLDRIVSECNALSQDSSHVLLFFVLKQVFAELSSAVEGHAVAVSAHAELTDEIAQRVLRLLDVVQGGQPVGLNQLEELVAVHIRNLNVFRSSSR